MYLLLLLLFLEVATPPQTSPIPDEIPDEIPFEIPGQEACANAANTDARPFMLCLAETRFEQAEAEMGLQLRVSLASVKAAHGPTAAYGLGIEQRDWVNRRDSECEAQAAGSPSTQVARNTLACQTQWTKQRTEQLKVLAEAE